MPYWDWAANITMPDIVNKPVIYVNSPSGFQSVINPLYNYTFHPQPSAADFPPNDAVSDSCSDDFYISAGRKRMHQVLTVTEWTV